MGLIITAAGNQSAWNRISATRMMETIRVLSSDAYAGRAPASQGEALTTAHLAQQFRRIGLKPGNPDGSYFQKVPMVGISADPDTRLVFTSKDTGKQETFNYAEDFVAWTKHVQSSIKVNADTVFVGYGVVAPEYRWDDFKGVDVRGKVIVVLFNDPPVPDPRDPSRLDEHMFEGKAMTYYGRPSYKFEEAARKGALGCLIVHQIERAGFPWEVVRNSNSGELLSLVSPDRGMSHSAVEGWITYQTAKALFGLAGKDFDALAHAAVNREFHPVDLHLNASLALHNAIRTIASNNVIGKLEGSDSSLRNQYVIYTAHWDHLGKRGDNIYHGAADNASGVAGLVELADVLAHAHPAPRRSFLFLSVTAEEKGLLGSKYYTERPLYPLANTVAEINMDIVNVLGRTRDIEIIGAGQSSLDDAVKIVAAEQGRVVKPDAQPEQGFYFRSDQFNFARAGVPALYIHPGIDFIGKSAEWGLQMREQYIRDDYHKPSDQIKSYWDLSGAVEDLRLLAEVGYRTANDNGIPTLKPGSGVAAKQGSPAQH